jgi:hypothetical protein
VWFRNIFTADTFDVLQQASAHRFSLSNLKLLFLFVVSLRYRVKLSPQIQIILIVSVSSPVVLNTRGHRRPSHRRRRGRCYSGEANRAGGCTALEAGCTSLQAGGRRCLKISRNFFFQKKLAKFAIEVCANNSLQSFRRIKEISAILT